MRYIKKIYYLVPFTILFLLLSLLGREIFSASPGQITASLVGETVPSFNVPSLFSSQQHLTQNDLRGHVSLLNIWASWCSACALEHPLLMRIKNVYHVPLYGILYKDNSDDATAYLKNRGNPYTAVGNDESGEVSIDLGIYGTPETFVISPEGRILYRQTGAMDQTTWDVVIYPLIKNYESKQKN